MYNKIILNRLIDFISKNNSMDKERLSTIVQEEFNLIKDRKVYYCDDFAIRFSKSDNIRMSNTVLSLSSLQKFDNRPFIVCIVTSSINYLLLANSTFLNKISHSSQALRIDNIKGSFNGTDIIRNIGSIENRPKNFEELYTIHCNFSFQDNLERLVEATNGIVGRTQKFPITSLEKQEIFSSIKRAMEFITSSEYQDLKKDLDDRVSKYQAEIAIASFIDNVNIRGRIIEYLITDSDPHLKKNIIFALKNNQDLPKFKTFDNLGDFSKIYPAYNTETDVKTKIMFLNSNPKGYNIDKLLEFLSTKKSIYMIYILGINIDGSIVARLCSIFDYRLLKATNILHHWAGRNSRGVTQFIGKILTEILNSDEKPYIDQEKANTFLNELIER